MNYLRAVTDIGCAFSQVISFPRQHLILNLLLSALGMGTFSAQAELFAGSLKYSVSVTKPPPPDPEPDDQVDSPLLILPSDSAGWVRLSAIGRSNAVYSIEASTNLWSWAPIAVTHGGIVNYPDVASTQYPKRFYRYEAKLRTETNDWKNQVHFPVDPFRTFPNSIGQDFQWIKFAISLRDPSRVYYQDSQKYDFHYDFASRRLEGFLGMTPAQFDQVALHTNQQQILLGTLLIPPYPNDSEFGIQFVGQDPYAPEFIAQHFELVKATIAAPPQVSAFYVPVFEQTRAAESHREYFEQRGIKLTTSERWLVGDDIYSAGWALGRLKFFPGTEINAAFTEGRLLPQDILLTDGVPAEIPVLAGVLTLSPSTPNSHVAILAKSFGLPFVYLSDPAQRERIQQLVGKDILLRLDPFMYQILIMEVDTSIDPSLRQEILNLKSPPQLKIVAKARYGAISASTSQLTPADIQYFGGKASNFGFLRRQIPDRSHNAIAFSFDLWDEFLDQELANGKTLRAEIQGRLSAYTYPPSMAALKKDLADIRSLITRTARFTSSQQAAILAALSSFDASRNIRFRSSTNVEDSEQFTGAGLYDSFSGCLQDDLDQDTQGPSHCDPTENEERGVFRAIQKVYASFYNDNAFIERLRHQVDESAVGMALLVHHSTPDETEWANGVAALEVNKMNGFTELYGDLVTQKGAASVTNPDGNAKPEVVNGYLHSQGSGAFLRQRSSLVPLGAYVMDWRKDYLELMDLFAKVAHGYSSYFTNKSKITLDFEYKKVAPGILDVKQVREIPVLTPTNLISTYLLHETNSYWVLQGEAADIFSNHRLKSLWSFQVKNLKLVETNLVASLFEQIEAESLDNGAPIHWVNDPVALPNYSHDLQDNQVIDGWSFGDGASRRDFELKTELQREVMSPEAPVFKLSDFRVVWKASYTTPQPILDYDFINGQIPALTTNHEVVLEPRRVHASTNYLQQRSASAGDLTIQIEFFWPAPPSKGIGMKTAPLAQWKETRIQGLTSQPISLRGYYSQTYRPGHHNFTEEFIFEPSLESDLSPQQRSELQAANVQFLYVFHDFGSSKIAILGLDGKFRFLN